MDQQRSELNKKAKSIHYDKISKGEKYVIETGTKTEERLTTQTKQVNYTHRELN